MLPLLLDEDTCTCKYMPIINEKGHQFEIEQRILYEMTWGEEREEGDI